MTDIALKGGAVAIVDPADADRVLAHRWRACSNGRGNVYVRRCGSGSPVYLHRFVIGAQAGELVDHANGDGLDNRRANLRIADHSANGANRHSPVRGSSRFRGVYWNRRLGRWHAQIGGGNSTTYIGQFDDEAEAARAYDRAATERFGAFAAPNFPEEIAS